MGSEFLMFLAVGFFAQVIDGALGMAFGIVSTSVLLTMGVPIAQASAAVHTAEVFTTGASGLSHIAHGNVCRTLLIKLAVAGCCGAIVGAYLLSNIDGRILRPFIATYLLLMGCLILRRALSQSQRFNMPNFHVAPVGVAGGFLDAVGGGGWGSTVTSSLLGTGRPPREIIGTVNTAEFFVTTAAATTFFVELGLAPLEVIMGLVTGGVLAAPIGARIARFVPARQLLIAVGCLIIALALYQLAHFLTR